MGMTTAERSARHRAKDVDAYRAKKNAYATTPAQRRKRVEYMRKWRAKNREKHNRFAREYHAKMRLKPEYKAKAAAAYLWRTFQLTIDDLKRMAAKQDGRCAICGTDKPNGKGGRLHVDHDHMTGKIRGLLCMTCNTYLGWFERNQERVQRYLAFGVLEPAPRPSEAA